MRMFEIENGKLVFTEDGAKAEYLGKVANGHVVNVYGEAYDGYGDRYEEPMGLQIVQRVFLTSPVTVYDEKISEKKSEVAAAEQRLRDIERETQVAQRERLDLIKKLQQIPALRHLEDFIEGRITHVVQADYSGYEIKTFDEAFKEGGSLNRRGKKLLTLFGDAGGDLHWRLSTYSDGSGFDSAIIPCISLEHAEASRRDLIATRLASAMADYAGGRKYLIRVTVAAADKFGVPVSDDQRAAHVDAEREHLGKERADVKRAVDASALRLTGIDEALAKLELRP